MRPLCFLLIASASLFAWGARGHRETNRAAMRALANGGPEFLKAHEDYIVALAPVPDSWRTPAEPFAKIFEDPNHGWFREQAPKLMANPPRSRYEFVVELYREQEKTKDRLTNVRWTGTLPYAAMETYERVKAGMRRYRMALAAKEDTRFAELEIATNIGYLGHYVADGANPMHDTIHHDGWVGDNPKGFTTDPRVHGRFETGFVELIQLTAADLKPRVGEARVLADPFAEIMKHIDASYGELEHAYALDKAGALADKENAEAKALVCQLLGNAAGLLRDLVHTAWMKSAETYRFSGSPNDPRNKANPLSPDHPRYNPATGSAPAEK